MTDTTNTDNFQAQYVAALRRYLDAGGENNLAMGHELGRKALQDRISMLDIIESHFQTVEELSNTTEVDAPAALEFLLQTLAALDVATRGFLDGTRRYAEQRARAEDLADRHEFRRALVNSLQEGFFVADHDGSVIEINSSFADILGYTPEHLPYRWPHPWTVDTLTANQQRELVWRDGNAQYKTPARHRDGHLVWVTVSINVVRGPDAGLDVYVGTVRDITAERALAAREGAVLRLATAVGVATSLAEVLSVTLDECRETVDVQHVIAVMWPPGGGEPTVLSAGEPAEISWRTLDSLLRRTFQEARHQLPLTVKTVEWPGSPDKAQGLVAVLSGAADVALWLELRVPRSVIAEDRLLVTVLIGHLSVAIQHVRQFESARETSLTLQRAMLPSVKPPPGFAVRYEPAVTPLEIGGDWYDVLPIDEHRIGIVVGDCVGRGLPAAAIMGQLRSSARALLLTGAQPGLLLEQLDATASLIPDAYCTTVFLAILDTESGILDYSNAGHMPAVLVESHSGAELLADAGSVPLAVRRADSRPQASQLLLPGSTLMLFTDGLVERRHESIDDGLARIAEVVTDTSELPINDLADEVLRRLTPAKGYDDDVAMVVYRHQLTQLRIETEATADQLVRIRRRLALWLRAANVPDALAADIVLVINEACTNSIEHAYRGHSVGTMLIEAEFIDGEIRTRVADSGSWKTPAADQGNRGRGLILVQEIGDSVEIDSSETGTTMSATFSLPTSAKAR